MNIKNLSANVQSVGKFRENGIAPQRGLNLIKYWPGCSWQEAMERYGQLFSKQDGRCAICFTHQSELKRSLFVDHSHATGNVRGLLCGKCNSMIGLAKEDLHILQNAKEYIRSGD